MEYQEMADIPVLDPGRTMEIILRGLREVAPYELAVVLRAESKHLLTVQWGTGPLYTPRLHDYAIDLRDRPELAQVVESGRTHVFRDRPHEGYIHQDTYDEVLGFPTGHSCLVAPLHVEGKMLGLLTLDHRSCDLYTEQTVRTTEILSRVIALALSQAIATETLLTEREVLVHERDSLLSDLPNAEGLVGRSAPWVAVMDRLRLVGPTDSPVLIHGETGTGKEQVAKALHALSPRAGRPFIALNCSALVSSLVESELFGHERGSFTGASARRRGRFELASNGTLFLDEVGDLPLDVQPKLLRALQEKRFERVGGEHLIQADPRIICASNLDLEKMVSEGAFRRDLYYRLNVFSLYLPPLRDRGDDVLLLADTFLARLAARAGKERFFLSPSAVDFLVTHPWPGNVRELLNTLERATILCAGDTLDVGHLQDTKGAPRSPDASGVRDDGGVEELDEMIRKHILRALEATGGKVYGTDGAAVLLGLKPTTLQSKMRKLGIAPGGRRRTDGAKPGADGDAAPAGIPAAAAVGNGAR